MVTGAANHVIDDFMLGEDLEGVGPDIAIYLEGDHRVF